MRHSITTLVGIALLVGCGGEPTSNRGVAAGAIAASQARLGAAVERDLATLRRATAPYHVLTTAMRAGWATPITGCMEDPTLGGMGVHYANVGLIDGVVAVDQPELLVYAPERNGRMRLVAVEYIIPYAFHARDAAPPVLFGQPFQQNDVFQLWGLHAWVWQDNPSGIFAPWNPTVSCGAQSADMTAVGHD